MDELFQHRRRIMFRRLDDGAGGRISPPRIKPRPFAVIDGMDVVGRRCDKPSEPGRSVRLSHAPDTGGTADQVDDQIRARIGR